MTTHVTPTFFLKGVDPDKLLLDYQAGFFSRPIAPKKKIIIAQSTTILAPTYGSTNHDPVFCIKDKNNCSVVVATTGHANYQVFTRTGGELRVGGCCDRCKNTFTHTSVGYPIAYQEMTVLTNDSKDLKSARYRVLYVFWVEGEFCTFECALGYVRQFLALPADHRDTTLRDSERLLKMFYKLTHPNAPPLRPSQDPRLLISNGGSLTTDKWSDIRHIYVRTDRVLMIPAKVEYVQQNFLNPVVAIDLTRDTSTVVAPSS